MVELVVAARASRIEQCIDHRIEARPIVELKDEGRQNFTTGSRSQLCELAADV
jgi:hypothetical protein